MFKRKIRELNRQRLQDELKINELRLRLTPNALDEMLRNFGDAMERQDTIKANRILDVLAKKLRAAFLGTSRTG